MFGFTTLSLLALPLPLPTATCCTAAASAARLCVICICRWQTESHAPSQLPAPSALSSSICLPARSFHCHPPEGIVCNVECVVACATRALIYWEWNLPKLWLILTNNLLYFLLIILLRMLSIYALAQCNNKSLGAISKWSGEGGRGEVKTRHW